MRLHKLTGAQLAIDILERSTCNVKVGAAIEDKDGRLISWGWNSAGPTGLGLHAECHAIQRANRRRLHYGTIYVASVRTKHGKPINSFPCEECYKLIVKYKMRIVWHSTNGWALTKHY